MTVPASRGVVLRLDAAPKLTLLPLPLLLGRLALLTTPAGDLAAALENLIGEDPLLSVLPPSAASIQDEHLHDEEFWEHIAAPTTLEEHLALQLPLIPEADILGENAAEKLSLCLDGRGYLAAPPEELARMLGVNQKDFEALLLRLRETVEPPGLFARTLRNAFCCSSVARFQALRTRPFCCASGGRSWSDGTGIPCKSAWDGGKNASRKPSGSCDASTRTPAAPFAAPTSSSQSWNSASTGRECFPCGFCGKTCPA